MNRKQNDCLFDRASWFWVESDQKKAIKSEIDAIDGNRLLNTSVDDLCNFFEDKFRIEIPELHEDQIVVDKKEIRIDDSQNPMRYIEDRWNPFYIPGTLIEVEIPFSGEAKSFYIKPTKCTVPPPRGEIRGNKLIINVQGINMDPQQVKSEIYWMISEIKKHIDRLRTSANGFNKQICQIAKEQINERRQKLLADQNLVASFGFPLKEHPDAPKTYIAPNIKKRIVPIIPSASSDPYEPEPELSMEIYEHILSVMNQMTLVMERSPSEFSKMKEETLRSHFLVQLNGHYEGQATGETFNGEGKTDILIRTKGKNIFIAECKYWRGEKKFSEAIDQILGYLSWRDTKAAIVVFNRNKNFSQIIEKIPDVVKKHPNFKKEINDNGEGRCRFVLSHRGDKNREMILTVLAFDVPQKD